MNPYTDEKINKRIGELLKKAREHEGYSIRQVSNFTMIDETTISKFENGSRMINLRNLSILLAFFNVKWSTFFNDFD